MSARNSARTRGGDRLMRSEPFELFKRPQRSLPARAAGLIVRMRAELLVLVIGVTTWVLLTDRMPVWTAALAIVVPGIGLACWAPSRRFVVRRCWAVATRHRLRAVFVECRIMNFSGNLPLLLWSRPIPVGERVWVLLRAGIGLRDIELRLSHIAVGCFGTDARVVPVRLTAALVAVDVVRRDPLRGPAVKSPVSETAQEPKLRVVPSLGGGQSA